MVDLSIIGAHRSQPGVAPVYTARQHGSGYSSSNVHVATVAELRAGIVAQADTYLVLLNGSYVPFAWDAASTATDDGQTCLQVTGVATGRYRARVTRALPPYCYGDPSVAIELMNAADSNATDPTSVDVMWVGTSRSTGLVIQNLCHTAAPGLPWGGCQLTCSGLNSVAWTNASITQATTTSVSAFGSYLGRYTPTDAVVATFNGGSAPGGNDLVCRVGSTSGFSITSRVYSDSSIRGRAVTVRFYYLAEPSGVTGAHLRFGVRVGALGTQTYVSDYFSTYSATREVRYIDATIPSSFDWTANPDITPELIYRQGQATVNGETCTSFGVRLIANRGINTMSGAVGGRWTSHFADEDIFSGAIFNSFMNAGDAKQLWIELGTNGTGVGFTSVAQDRAYKETIISRFREYFPTGKVLLISAYPASGNPPGTSTWYRESDMQIANSLPGVLAIDTQRAMPVYPAGVAASYYADTVHYNDTGRAAWVAKIAQLCNQAA